MGLESVLAWIMEKINEILPFFFVMEYEEAVHLRGGKFLRVCKKGFYWKLFMYDDILTQHVVTTTLSLSAQSLVTKDDKGIVAKAIVKYRIFDVKTFLLEVYDSVDAIADVAQGVIKDIIMSSTWDECRNVEIDNTLTKKIRNELKKFGVQIDKVTLTDIAPIRSLRLFNEQTSIINNG